MEISENQSPLAVQAGLDRQRLLSQRRKKEDAIICGFEVNERDGMCFVCIQPFSPRSAEGQRSGCFYISECFLIVSDYLFDVQDKAILKDQGEYFIGGIQHRKTPVVVAVQPVSLLVYGVDDAEIPITRHRFAIPMFNFIRTV